MKDAADHALSAGLGVRLYRHGSVEVYRIVYSKCTVNYLHTFHLQLFLAITVCKTSVAIVA